MGNKPNPDLLAEITALESMTPKQLREKYREVWGEETRSGNPSFMRKRLAWRMQANAFGDLPERVRKKALALARDSDLRTTAPRSVPHLSPDASTVTKQVRLSRVRGLTAGTQLARVYKGKTQIVTVLEEGFAWEGKKFSSLSATAKAITGTHISGNAFFGLTGKRKQETIK